VEGEARGGKEKGRGEEEEAGGEKRRREADLQTILPCSWYSHIRRSTAVYQTGPVDLPL